MESENTHSGDIYAVLGWLEKNRKNLITAVVVVILAGVVYFYFNWKREQGQITAGEALSALYLNAAGANVAAGDLLKFADANAGTDAGARALLAAAGQQLQDNKAEDAKACFQRFINDYPENPLMAQAKYGIAVCLETQGKSADAINAYREVADRYHDENAMMPAKLALGRLYEADKKLEQARDAYMDISRDTRSTMGAEAQARLVELFQKHPELRPKAPEPAVGRTMAIPSSASPAQK